MKISFRIKTKSKLIIILFVLSIIEFIFLGVHDSVFKSNQINTYVESNSYQTPANSSFTDDNFYQCVVDAYNKKSGTNIAYTENLTDNQLDTITSLDCRNKGIKSVSGLEKMLHLTTFYVSSNQLTSIDVSKNVALKDLAVDKNQLTSVDVSKNSTLEILWVANNQLTNVDVSKNLALTKLYAYSNQLTSVDVSKNSALEFLWISDNQLTNLDVSKNLALTELHIYNNKLTSIDVSKNSALTNLNAYNNQLTSIDVSKNLALTNLIIGGNQITNIDLSKNKSIEYLSICVDNPLVTIDLSNNVELKDLSIMSDLSDKIDFSKLTKLETISYCYQKVIPVYGTSFITNDILTYVPNYLTISDYEFKKNYTNPQTISDNTITGNVGDYYQLLLQAKTVTNHLNSGFNGTQKFSGFYDVYFVILTSDKYVIDESNSKIDVGGDSDEEILKNLKINPTFININISGNNLKLSYLGNEFKTFQLQRVANPKTGVTFIFLVGFMVLLSLVAILVIHGRIKEKNLV